MQFIKKHPCGGSGRNSISNDKYILSFPKKPLEMGFLPLVYFKLNVRDEMGSQPK